MDKGHRVSQRASPPALGACLIVLLVLAGPGGAGAQSDPLLDRVERLTDRGETLAARDLLAQWRRDESASAAADERAWAWFLEARLATDGAQAELLYLRVVIEGSTSRYADDALLRLGQYKYTGGDYVKAIEYLGRLRRDYPTSERGPAALLWIARASVALGNSERACSASTQGLREVAISDTTLALALNEAQARCADSVGRYSVQVAAVRDAVAAQRLAQDLLGDGYDAWILNATPRDPLYRVRVGRGLGEEEAQALLRRLASSGFSPFLVSEPTRTGGGQ